MTGALPEKIFVEQLTDGDMIDTTFALAAVALKEYTGGHFLQMRMSDRTGKIGAILWKGGEKIYPRLKVGDIVRVRGKIETYRDRLQIHVHALHRLDEEALPDLDDYLRLSPVDPQQTWQELTDLAQSLASPHYQALWQLFAADEALIKGFLRAPGGKQWHHAYIGGLAEHTLGVARQCQLLADLYPRANRDMLLMGAFFHDLGKIEELLSGAAIDYTDIGRLVGHQVIGHRILCRYLDQLPDFPSSDALQLQHLLLAHHGESDDAVRVPMTFEAILLSRADDLDAQANAYARELDKAAAAGRPWTDYVNLINRYLYRGPDEETDEAGDTDES